MKKLVIILLTLILTLSINAQFRSDKPMYRSEIPNLYLEQLNQNLTPDVLWMLGISGTTLVTSTILYNLGYLRPDHRILMNACGTAVAMSVAIPIHIKSRKKSYVNYTPHKMLKNRGR